MITCQRGFLMVRNMRTGAIRPFFLKVREQDIVWKDQAETRDDIVTNEILDGWLTETHTLLHRTELSKRTVIPILTYVSTRKATAKIRLPFTINPSTAVITINKESGDSTILQNSVVEAVMTDVYETGLSDTIEVSLLSTRGEFTSSNIAGISGYLNIVIHGFTE